MVLLILAGACLAGFVSYQHGYTESIAEGQNSASNPKTHLRERPAADDDTGKPQSAKRTIAEKTQRLEFLADRTQSTSATAESWEIIRDLGELDVRELLDQFEKLEKYQGENAAGYFQISMLYFRWAQLDPVSALEAAGTHNAGYRQDVAFESWMKKDPAAAFRWAASSEKFKDSQISTDLMALHLADLTPNEALRKAAGYGDKIRAATLKRISQNQADTPEGREAFFSGISDGGLSETEKPPALKAFFTTWAARDPLKALDQLAAVPLKQEQQTELRQQVLKTWSRNDPEAALTWMIGKSDALPDARQLNYFRYWNQGTPLRASAWLARQSPEIQQKFKLTP